MTTKVPLAVVGNGGAAAEAVLALRTHGYSDEIHLFADNEHAPYNPMLGTYLVSGALPLKRVFPFGDERRFYGGNRVTAHLGCAVTHLDAHEQILTTADEVSREYDRCLVACGARPAVPQIPGLREALALGRPGPSRAASEQLARRAFTIQSLQDALDLKVAVETLRTQRKRAAPKPRGGRSSPIGGPRAAVIGASFAGLKVAAALNQLGLSVCLIEREPNVLPLSAHVECARLIEAHLLAEGYELRLGAVLAGVDAEASGVRLDFGALPGVADPGGAGGTACEESPTQEDVDLVVVCTGSRPALGFLTPGQVDLGTGILVDEQLRSNIPTLYAAGDAAQGKDLLSGRHEIIGLWTSARYQGRAAGRSLAGAASAYAGGVPHNITSVGRMLFASIGCLDDYDRIDTGTEADTFRLRAYRDGRLVGVNLLGGCHSAGVVKQGLLRAAVGAATGTEATWTNFSV